MTLELHGVVPGSRAFRCLWLLEELGLPYHPVPVDFRSEQVRDPAYLALNPNGRVPTLVDGDVVLFESLAINLYLAQKQGGALWPEGDAGVAAAYQWSFWVVADLDGPHDVARREGRSLSPEAMRRSVDVLEGSLRGRSHLVEERFTVADLNVVSVLLRPTLPQVVAEFPGVAQWRRACTARPALARALAALETAPDAPAQ